MPIYEPDHIEYSINSGHVQIVMDDAAKLPAYWAHPMLGKKFPAVALIHDWWGIGDMIRRIANLIAQTGYYVIVPDLFDGRTASSHKEALKLVESLENDGYPRVHNALSVLENHHHCNRSVAAVGVGMGGSLAFEAAITRSDLEAAVAFAGFPQRYLGRIKHAHAPIYAFYGEHEPYIEPAAIKRLRDELAHSELAHRLEIVPDLGHEFFSDSFDETQRARSREVLQKTFAFLDKYLEAPSKRTTPPVY